MIQNENKDRNIVTANIGAVFLLVLGLLQTMGVLTQNRIMRGLGLASAASPYPRVFCQVKSPEGVLLEPFASDFILEAVSRNGEKTTVTLNPELYKRVKGPYNRRNVYGAALSYAPVMPEPLVKAVTQYGLKKGGPLREEIGFSEDVESFTLVIKTRTRGRDNVWKVEIPCGE